MTVVGDKEAREIIATGVTTMWRLGGQVSADKFHGVDKDTGELPTQYKVISNGKYSGVWVSSYGDIMTPKGHIVTNKNKNNAGFITVTLRVGGKLTTTTLARLVALAWIPNPAGLSDVKHKGLQDDDRAENLVWAGHGSTVTRQTVPVSAIDIQTGDIVHDYQSVSDASMKTNISYTAIRGSLVYHTVVGGYRFLYTRNIGKAEEILH